MFLGQNEQYYGYLINIELLIFKLLIFLIIQYFISFVLSVIYKRPKLD
jgi:hypothetical protein